MVDILILNQRPFLEAIYVFIKAIDMELQENVIPIDSYEYKYIKKSLEKFEQNVKPDKTVYLLIEYRKLYDYTVYIKKYYK